MITNDRMQRRTSKNSSGWSGFVFGVAFVPFFSSAPPSNLRLFVGLSSVASFFVLDFVSVTKETLVCTKSKNR